MDLTAALQAFPPVDLAFAYGSGVFQQSGYAVLPSGDLDAARTPSPMVDLVFAVSDPLAWHADNLSRNRAHYSALGALGAAAVARVQTSSGARMYYNTLVPLPREARGAPGQMMKYGVIHSEDLLDDLLTWRHLYAAGRLHKPVRVLSCGAPRLLAAARENLRHALRAALLQLPRRFTAVQLYTAVAGLSYTGDFRMVVGENPNKVANIVEGSLRQFHALYAPLLAASFPTVAPVAAARAREEEGAGPPLSPRASPPSALGPQEGGAPLECLAPCAPLSDAALETSLTPGAPLGEAALRALCYEQDTSPEARVALGMALPFRLQRRMAEAWAAEEGRLSPREGAREALAEEAPAEGGRLGLREGAQEAPAPGAPSAMARARMLAARGRALMQRLRRQRLQWLLARRERAAAGGRPARSRSAAALAAAAGAEDEIRHILEVEAAEAAAGVRNILEVEAEGGAAAGVRIILEVEPEGGAAAAARLSPASARLSPASEAEAVHGSGPRTLSAGAAAAAVWPREPAAPSAEAPGAAPSLEATPLSAEMSPLPASPARRATLGEAPPAAARILLHLYAPPPAPPRRALSYDRALCDEGVVRFWGALAERVVGQAAASDEGRPPPARRMQAGAAQARVPAAAPGGAGAPGVAGALRPQAPARGDVATALVPFLRPAIAHIVGAAARWQSLKGVLTAGPVKAAHYGAAKIGKMAGGWLRKLKL